MLRFNNFDDVVSDVNTVGPNCLLSPTNISCWQPYNSGQRIAGSGHWQLSKKAK